MRIVLIGPAKPFRGGIAQFTDATAEALRRRGHTVDVVTFSRQYPRLLFPGKSQLEPGGTNGNGAPWIDSLNPVSWRRAARRIAEMNPDAAIFQYWLPFFGPAYGAIARYLRKRGTRVLAVLHNVIPHEQRPGDSAMGRFFLKHSERFIALSESVAGDLKSLGIDAPVVVTPHPVYEHFGDPIPRNDARRKLELPEDAEVLLFFGFIRRYKGLHVLLKAMPEVVRHRPKVRLLVAGEFYEDEEMYREMIRTRHLDEHVQVVPEYVEKDRVGTFFSAADVVVQPYETATQSGVVQTAFQFERPVIVTNVGGLAELVKEEDSGLVVPPGDAGALALAIIRFFEDSLSKRFEEGARREKARNSWDTFADVVEAQLA